MYDVCIIGAGVVGANIARELSRYQLNICVLDREDDVSCGCSKANSGIVHGGYSDAPGSLKAELCVAGNRLYAELEKEFGYKCPDGEAGDLTTEAEHLSYEWVKKKYGHEFLFITDYSAEKRAFYHMRDENGVPQGYDLIWRGVEITTGAQREHRYEVLKKQAEEKGLADDVKFYLEFFQYGCPPHGGFGLGIDRLTMLLCGLSIKDAEFLFRGPNRLTP